MIIKLMQKKLKWNFQYDINIDNNSSYTAEANRTILTIKKKLLIKDKDENVIIELLEKNMLRKFLLNLPFVGLVVSFFCKELCTYNIIQDDKVIGDIVQIRDYAQPRIEAHMNEKKIIVYKFNLGTKGIKYPVYYNNVQVGLIGKSEFTNLNADNYYAQFDTDSNVICNILMTVFVDLVFHGDDISSHVSVAEVKYEWNPLQGYANVKYDENWRPK